MKTFEELGINTELIEALKKDNITIPTDIQEKVIALIGEGKDVIAQSQTGTGKTLAYLLPLFQKIDTEKRENQVIVLAPTHELGVQIQKVAEALSAASGMKVTSTPIIGDVKQERQIEKLKDKPHMIIGSAGRILELIKLKKIKAHTVKTIVVDEADRLLDTHNIENVKAIIKTTLRERQLLLFSASISDSVIEKAKVMQKEPVIVKVEEKTTMAPGIEHFFFISDQREKAENLRKLVRIINPARALVFINKNDEVDILSEKLKYHQIKADSIHGTAMKLDRKKALADFRSGKIQLLISSDISSRGLDVSGVSHVFNLDLPEDIKNYLHRAGRTARAGAKGTTISIVTPEEMKALEKIEKAYEFKAVQIDMYHGKIIREKQADER